MPLPTALKRMLLAPFILERYAGEDLWGNETYDPVEAEVANIGPMTISAGSGTQGEQNEEPETRSRSLLVDAIGLRVRDRVTFDGDEWYVTEVQSFKDQQGGDLYQEATVENQKRG